MLKNLTTILIMAAVSLVSVFVVGCESGGQAGAGIGALAGAGIGQLAGRSTEATLIGAAIGGGAGYMVGNEADKKQARAERAYLSEEMNYVTEYDQQQRLYQPGEAQKIWRRLRRHTRRVL